MKALMLTGIRQMALREAPDPALEGNTDVRVRIHAVGLCGSDVHYYKYGRIGCNVVEYPFIVGHECAGTVEEAGSAVTRVRPGDRVAIEPTISCLACHECKRGRLNTCLNQRFISCPGQAPGALCEYVVVPERNCYPIGDVTSFERASISEPFAIGYYATRLVPNLRGARIGILGAGPIGRCVLAAAQVAGVQKAYVTDKVDARLEAARAAGADWTGNPDKTDIVEAIMSGPAAPEPNGLDIVFECCGQQDALDQAVGLSMHGGHLLIIGIPTEERISFDVDLFRRREIVVHNVRRQNECGQAALDLLESGRVDLDALITHRFSLEDAQAGFELAAGYEDGIVKAMVSF